jgi:hypothetical protein
MRLILLSPAGLASLIGLAAPILVHLLLRRRARRVPFPSLRFVQPSHAAAVRLRAITDWRLLCIRCAVVAAAALALARPLLVTPDRRDGWNARTVRAIVVDATPSAGRPSPAVDEERRKAFRSTVIQSEAIDDGIAEAVNWLTAAPPARREVVVLSDFQRGTVDRVMVDRVPASIGVRLRQIISEARSIAEPEVRVTVQAPARDRAAVEPALRAAGEDSGSPRFGSGPSRRTVAIYTRDAAPPRGVGRLLAPWMAAVAPAVANARTGAIDERSMVIALDAPASSFELPRTIRAVRRVLLAPAAWRELEPGRLPQAALAALSRPSQPIADADMKQAEEHDGRWLWLAGLAFIGLETWLRRRLDAGLSKPSAEEQSRAA